MTGEPKGAALDERLVPALGRGCRVSPEKVLLMPEGIIKLSASALRILELCDGKRSVAAIIEILKADYAPAMHVRIRADVVAYVERLAEKKALELK